MKEWKYNKSIKEWKDNKSIKEWKDNKSIKGWKDERIKGKKEIYMRNFPSIKTVVFRSERIGVLLTNRLEMEQNK